MAGIRVTQLVPYALPGRRYGSFANKAKAAPGVAVIAAAAVAVAAGAPYIPRPVIYFEFALVEWPRPSVSAHESVTHNERGVRVRPFSPRIWAYDSHTQAVHVEGLIALVSCYESASMAEFPQVRIAAVCEAKEEMRFSLSHLMMVELDDVMLGLR